jgi:hypothetical protein
MKMSPAATAQRPDTRVREEVVMAMLRSRW